MNLVNRDPEDDTQERHNQKNGPQAESKPAALRFGWLVVHKRHYTAECREGTRRIVKRFGEGVYQNFIEINYLEKAGSLVPSGD